MDEKPKTFVEKNKIGIIVLTVAVLITIFLIIFIFVFSNIETITPIGDIKQHANSYIGKTVTVKAYYSSSGFSVSPYYVISDSTGYIYVTETTNIVKPTLISGSYYKFTGIVKYGQVTMLGNEAYIEVSKIEAT